MRQNADGTEQIRAGIEQSQAEMGATLGALQQRLGPDRLKDQAKDVIHEAAEQAKEIIQDAAGQAKEVIHEAVQDAGQQAKQIVHGAVQDASEKTREAVHDATIGKAEEAMTGAARTAKGVGSTMIETIKQNPIPSALVGIGLGWLLFKGQSGSPPAQRSYPPSRGGWDGQAGAGRNERGTQYGFARWDAGDGRGAYTPAGIPQDSGNGLQRTVGQAAGRAQDAAGQAAGRVQDTVGQMTDRVQDTVGQVTDRVQDTAGQMTDRVQETAGQVVDQVQQSAGRLSGGVQDTTQQVTGTVRGQFQQMMRESPLVVGGLALAAGLAIGLALPATDSEDELMGGARDSFMEQAKETAQDTQQKLQQVAQEAGKTAQEEAKQQHLVQ